jgi:hypothetical protein
MSAEMGICPTRLRMGQTSFEKLHQKTRAEELQQWPFDNNNSYEKPAE